MSSSPGQGDGTIQHRLRPLRVGSELSAGGSDTSGARSQWSRHATESLVQSFFVADETPQVICGCRCSGNMRVLALTALLFMIITVAQTAGAIISNSAALLADCISMAVDSGTYFLNMLAESQRGKYRHRWLQLIIPAISLSLLIYFTLDVMRESLEELECCSENEDADVNPYIVFVFALWGIIFDSASLLAFMRNQRKSGGHAGVNMVAAFTHVAADFARSITTFVESIFLFAFDWNGVVVDAWSCIIVSITILFGAAYAFHEWGKELSEFIREARHARTIYV